MRLISATLTTPAGTARKTGIGNSVIGQYLAYHRGSWASWYGVDFWTPGFGYIKGAPLNVGGHCMAFTPVNQAMAGDGNRGQNLAIGPEFRSHLGPLAVVLKCQKDTLVRNRPAGQMFWFQCGLPLNHGRE